MESRISEYTRTISLIPFSEAIVVVIKKKISSKKAISAIEPELTLGAHRLDIRYKNLKFSLMNQKPYQFLNLFNN